jgi:hypothetical protein
MPLLILGFFALQIDRANIASALTSTITKDLHITTDEINVGNQLLSVGIFLLEIPSNMLLVKVTSPSALDTSSSVLTSSS